MSWAIASFALLVLALALQLAMFERGRPSPRSLALVAALAGLAVAGRLAFAPLPNVKPTTDIVLIAGFALGASPGFAVGAVTALVSNMAFGQGPWTPWQMLAWGMVGVVGAGIARATGGRIGRWGLATAGAACGLLFGTIMDISQWLTYGGEPRVSKLLGFMLTSLPWNIAHAAGNAAFALAFGPLLISAVRRARQRLQPEWLPVGTPLAVVGLPALLALTALLPNHALHAHAASTASGRASAWLLSAQNRDGGFGSDRGGSSAPMTTAWAALGLAAAGHRLDRTSLDGGRTVLDRLRADARSAGDPGARQRLVLAAVAGGADPSSFGGRNLLEEVRAGIADDGAVRSPGGQPAVNLTAFAVLALAAADRGVSDSRARAAVSWIKRQQQPDGGFGSFPKGIGGSDVDDTAAALEALAAVDALDGSVRSAALGFLDRARSRDGGFPLVPGQKPNSQSTAWAIQGLIAAGEDHSAASRWLHARVAPGGRVSYAPGSVQSPVWVTSQALMALAGKTLPIAAPPREPRSDAPGAKSHSGAPSGPSKSSAGKSTQLPRRTDRRLARATDRREAIQAVAAAVVGARVVGAIVGALVRAFGGPKR